MLISIVSHDIYSWGGDFFYFYLSEWGGGPNLAEIHKKNWGVGGWGGGAGWGGGQGVGMFLDAFFFAIFWMGMGRGGGRVVCS